MQEVLMQDEASRKVALTQKRKAFSGAQKRMEDLDKIIQRLYEYKKMDIRIWCVIWFML